MTLQITQNARRQFGTIEDAERAVEVFYPVGYLYQITPIVTVAGNSQFESFAVRVWPLDGSGASLGYAYDPDEAAMAGVC